MSSTIFSIFTGDFVYITDRAYSESQIREMEMKILAALGFDLGRPLPLHFLRRNSKAGNVDALTHTLAKYVMELTLVNYEMAHWVSFRKKINLIQFHVIFHNSFKYSGTFQIGSCRPCIVIVCLGQGWEVSWRIVDSYFGELVYIFFKKINKCKKLAVSSC